MLSLRSMIANVLDVIEITALCVFYLLCIIVGLSCDVYRLLTRSESSIDVDEVSPADWFVASTFPSLLSPSPSFTALGSVVDSLDLDITVSDMSLSEFDTSIVGTFPSLFSSPSFTALGVTLNSDLDTSYDDGASRPRVKRTRFAEFVDVLVFEKEDSFYDDSAYEQFATDDSDVSFDIDTSIFSAFPSLLSPSNSFSELGSVLVFDLDIPSCVAPVFSCTVTLMDDIDVSPDIDTAVVATCPSLLSPSSCHSISNSLPVFDLDVSPRVVSVSSCSVTQSVDDSDVSCDIDTAIVDTFPSLLSSSPSLDTLDSVFDADLEIAPSVDDGDVTCDIDTAIFATLSSLLSPSPSLSALASAVLSPDIDTVRRVAASFTSSSIDGHVSQSFDLDSIAIFAKFPSLLSSSPSFTALCSV